MHDVNRRSIDPLLMVESDEDGVSGTEATEALDELFREHRDRLVQLAAAVTFDRALAEEVVQDAFVGLQRQFGVVDNAAGYLQRSVINRGINALRRRRTANRYQPPPADVASTPEIDETWAAVVRLPVRQRTVVALRFWHDMTEADIAGLLGWPLGTVKSTLHRALKTLRSEMT